jgi:hypothetical protein
MYVSIINIEAENKYRYQTNRPYEGEVRSAVFQKKEILVCYNNDFCKKDEACTQTADDLNLSSNGAVLLYVLSNLFSS